MLQLSSTFYDREILSLRSGGPIGQALSPVINPKNLKIEGWYAVARGERLSYILPTGEVRDIINKGIVVDDHSSITPAEDLIRMKEVIELGFEIIGKSVVTESKRKLGKVQDYAVDSESMIIKKLYINQSMIKNFSVRQLIVDRNQIVEINDRKVVIKDLELRVRPGERAPATA